MLLTRSASRKGETIVHVGAGAGYYIAILAKLVRTSGRVIAYEVETDIAERARTNLARYAQVEVRARSGVHDALPKADCIYVNAAATHPVRAWLDALKVGGRLLFPLQAAHWSGGNMLLITRPGTGRRLAGPILMRRGVHRLQSGRTRAIGRRLDEAFRRGGRKARALAHLRRRAGGDFLAARRRLGAVDGAGRTVAAQTDDGAPAPWAAE